VSQGVLPPLPGSSLMAEKSRDSLISVYQPVPQCQKPWQER
jgi:hypothetical protein